MAASVSGLIGVFCHNDESQTAPRGPACPQIVACGRMTSVFARKFMCLATLLIAACVVFAQGPIVNPPIPVDEIVQKFAAKESEFKAALCGYSFLREFHVQSLDKKDKVTGEFQVVSAITFDSSCRLTEKILSAPANTLKGFGITPEDMQAVRDIESFILLTDNISKYNFRYRGKEMLNASDCYVLEVAPKNSGGQSSFTGQIWVDDKDFYILKLDGKTVADLRSNQSQNLFPPMEVTRELVDGAYWFPAMATSLDTLNFSTGSQRIRQVVRYDNYKK
jgi:outer membrane lipoprotein-sorting protein